MKRKVREKLSAAFYWLLILALLCLFFTNDFGLVDIHKTAIITAVGVDSADGEVQVTAQLAIPQPSENGENIQYVNVQGSGVTVADALSEIDAKTGFYPKLFFCKLVLLGESCQSRDIFDILDYFYCTEYSELTSDVAMCKGKASDVLTLPAPANESPSESLQRILSDEPQKSANVSLASLKDVALLNYSKSGACFMPYVEYAKSGTSESGGNGDSVGGESGGEPSSGSESSGSGEGQSGGSGESGQSGNVSQGMDFFCRRTALFSQGKFAAILDEHQAFALNLLYGDIRLAVLPCDAGGRHYTLGLKNFSGGISLTVENGVPYLDVKFSAKARVQDSTGGTVDDAVRSESVPKEVCDAANEELEKRFASLISVCAESGCDALGLKESLYRRNYKYYEAFGGDLLTRINVRYDISVKGVN